MKNVCLIVGLILTALVAMIYFLGGLDSRGPEPEPKVAFAPAETNSPPILSDAKPDSANKLAARVITDPNRTNGLILYFDSANISHPPIRFEPFRPTEGIEAAEWHNQLIQQRRIEAFTEGGNTGNMKRQPAIRW